MKRVLIILLALASVIPAGASGIYHNNWIDFNKNGRKDVYEDPKQPVEKRIDDLLSRMTLEEKTCQLVTLYGCDRVLHEPLPTEGWKSRVWKDGVANIDVTATITNTGSREGTEAVQLYVCDLVSSVVTYDSVLRGFERVSLKPGESRRVQLSLSPKDLQILDKDMNWRVEPGEFELMLGASYTDIRQKKTVRLNR